MMLLQQALVLGACKDMAPRCFIVANRPRRGSAGAGKCLAVASLARKPLGGRLLQYEAGRTEQQLELPDHLGSGVVEVAEDVGIQPAGACQAFQQLDRVPAQPVARWVLVFMVLELHAACQSSYAVRVRQLPASTRTSWKSRPWQGASPTCTSTLLPACQARVGTASKPVNTSSAGSCPPVAMVWPTNALKALTSAVKGSTSGCSASS